MKKKVILICLLIFNVSVWAQTDKQIQKAVKTFYKDYDKGIEKLNKYMDKVEQPRLKAWNTLVQMEYERYLRDKDIMIEVDDETLDEELLDYIQHFPYYRFINLCRKATILNVSDEADYYLRKLLIENQHSDSTFSDKAKSYFEEGEEFYEKKDWEKAALNFSKALKEEPQYYDACINLGKSYWNNEQIDSAYKYFDLAKILQPTYLEPFGYKISLLMDQDLKHRAKKECLEGICRIPGNDVKLQYQKILYQENKYMDEHRFIRYFYPNVIGKDQDDVNGAFGYYREAKKLVSDFCDVDGIIGENNLTDHKYLEVYCWDKMLREAEEIPEVVEFAQKMKEEGYLDCYVLISMYHIDFYPQVKHFLMDEDNRQKVKTYINTYLIKPIES
jgi:tetratricopeptide (TPR) repeat protein